MLLKTDASQRGGSGFGETSTGASVAKGEFERRDRASWFPGEPSVLRRAESGFLFRPLGTRLVLCASVYLTGHLSIEPLEQDPTFTALFIQSPWQSLGNDAKEGGKQEGRNGGHKGQADGLRVCF